MFDRIIAARASRGNGGIGSRAGRVSAQAALREMATAAGTATLQTILGSLSAPDQG
jgi:hypothetical protein